MKLLIAITLTPEQVKKIAWDKYGQWTSELPNKAECKVWLANQLESALEKISLPRSKEGESNARA